MKPVPPPATAGARDDARVPEFGEARPSETYHLRPGSYGIIRARGGPREEDLEPIALVQTPRGLFLPGGGQDPGESPEATLRREAREECGLEVEVGSFLGVADELTWVAEERRYCRKRCSFFRALALGTIAGGGLEADHRLEWLAAAEAAVRLTDGSQRWAIALWLRATESEERP